MEDILAMRKKNSPNSPSKIKEILQQISNAHFESDKVSHKLEGNLFISIAAARGCVCVCVNYNCSLRMILMLYFRKRKQD